MRKEIYLTHNELCDMFDVPHNWAVSSDEDALVYRPDVELWKLTVDVHEVTTKEE